MNPFQINRDRSVDQDKVFLVDRQFHPIRNGEIYPVSDLQIIANLNSNWECHFTIYRETDGIPNPLWDQITDLALVKIENKGIFELEAPLTDEAGTYKSCSGKSLCEAETNQTTMTLEINTEDDIARKSNTDPTASYYEKLPTVFYRNMEDFSVLDNAIDAKILQSLSNDEKKEILRRASLLHRVFSEMPEYAKNIDGDNIDESLKNLQYTFSWSNTSVYDICQDIAEEVQCIFIFDKFNRTFEVRDLKEHCEIDQSRNIQNGICPICRQNGTTQKITSFGKYSGVEIDSHNLAETITLSGNKDAVKNYFKIEGADDIITNRISNRLIGNGYLWKTGALQRSQMSAELIAALDAREQMMSEDYPAGSEFQNVQDEYNKLWDQWNALNLKKAEYQYGMMPSPETADQNAESIFHDLFGTNGKIQYACASNFFQDSKQIADSVMNYAKLLSPTNHVIEYSDLSCTTTTWNDHNVVDTITFKVHIYLDVHDKDEGETRKYADEYPAADAQNPNNQVTLSVSKGYITCKTEDNTSIYTTDYYNYLKRLIDTANAKSGITDEVITYSPITPASIAPDAASYHGTSLKPTHYSKYCYDRLASLCRAYEACSAIVSEINQNMPSESDSAVPAKTMVLSGSKLNEAGNCYFVVPFHSDLSLFKFEKNVTYSLTVSISSSYGFHSDYLMALLGASENLNPGSSRNILRSWSCRKKDLHTFVITFKGDNKLYSHLCIGLKSKSDYDQNYLFQLSMPVPDAPPASSPETVNILQNLKPDNKIGNNIQEDLLGKYKQYTVILSERMAWLQEQIQAMEESQNSLMARINKIKETCDMENYLNQYAQKNNVTRNLWHELCSFKRQDTYKNDNFFGEGLDEAKLTKNVEGLIKRAEEEMESACNITYSASATLSNLLVMPEFEPFWDKFTLGNYIHMAIDGQIHTMRLTSITYDYADLSHCSVEFSDVVRKTRNKTEEIANILSRASSLASSAKTTARQAENGAEAKLSVDAIKNDALNLANSKIITADDQNFIIDKYGITGKYMDPVSGQVSDEQIRIINNLLCFTDDKWMHTKTALGKITYLNPDTKEYDTKFGLIADTIIGNLIMSEHLRISDGNGTTWIDSKGIKVINGYLRLENDTGIIEINPEKASIFTITKKVNNGDNIEVIKFDSYGNANFTGTVNATSGNFMGDIVLEDGCLTTNKKRTSFDATVSGLTINKDGIGAYSSAHERFTLTSTGILTAAGVNITGEIHATKGYIGGTNGWTIADQALYNGCSSLSSTKTGTYIGTDGIRSNGENCNTKLQNGVLKIETVSPETTGITLTGKRLDTESNVVDVLSATIKNNYLDFSSNASKKRSAMGYIYSSEYHSSSSETGFYLINSENNVTGHFYMPEDSETSRLDCNQINTDNITLNAGGYILSNHELNYIGGDPNGVLYVGHWEYTKTLELDATAVSCVGTLYTSNGTVTSSDARLKTNMADIDEKEVHFILGLSPIKYKLKSGTSGRYHYGFLAQDVDELMQSTIGDSGLLVKQEQYLPDNDKHVPIDFQDDTTFYYGLRYEEFIAPMIKTIQKLNSDIHDLKKQVEYLKNQ